MGEKQPNRNILQRNRKRFVPLALGGLAVVGSLSSLSCDNYGDSIRDQNIILQEKGFFGDHPIVPLKDVPGFFAKDSISGSMVESLVVGLAEHMKEKLLRCSNLPGRQRRKITTYKYLKCPTIK